MILFQRITRRSISSFSKIILFKQLDHSIDINYVIGLKSQGGPSGCLAGVWLARGWREAGLHSAAHQLAGGFSRAEKVCLVGKTTRRVTQLNCSSLQLFVPFTIWLRSSLEAQIGVLFPTASILRFVYTHVLNFCTGRRTWKMKASFLFSIFIWHQPEPNMKN